MIIMDIFKYKIPKTFLSLKLKQINKQNHGSFPF